MPTQTLPNDWLLKTARWGCILLRWFLFFILAILALMIPFIFLSSAADLADFDVMVAGTNAENVGPIALTLLILVVSGLIVLAERILRQLQLIIESLGEGDPFIPENAQRLTTMAWLLLASQVIAISATTLTLFAAISEEWDFSGDFSLEGLFTVIILFILARVFRHGAAMRADLEGTV